MSPVDDHFLTCSKDGTVRMWNLQQAGCIAQMDLPGETEGDPMVAFDSTGMVFAVSVAMAGKQGNVSTSGRIGVPSIFYRKKSIDYESVL